MSAQVTIINRQGIASTLPSETYWNSMASAAERYVERDFAMVTKATPGFRHISYVYLDGQVHQTVITL